MLFGPSVDGCGRVCVEVVWIHALERCMDIVAVIDERYTTARNIYIYMYSY